MAQRFTGFDHLDDDLLDENGDIKWRHAPKFSNADLIDAINASLSSFPEGSRTRQFAEFGFPDGMLDLMRRLGNTKEYIVYKLIERDRADERAYQAYEFAERQRARETSEKAAREAEAARILAEKATTAAAPLPALIGTAKQIAWATSIREAAQLMEPGLPELKTATRAAWWIDNKSRWAMRRVRVSDADLLDSGRSDDVERFHQRVARREWDKNEY